jgi:hypothetical protein
MPPAVIAAGVVAAGTIGGAVLGSSAQKSAANQASQAQQDSTAAQLQLGHDSLDLQRQLAQQSMGLNQSIYNSNYDLLSPWVARGNVAGNAYNSLLGLPSAPTMHSPLETASGGLAPIPTTGGTALTTASTPASPAYSGPTLEQIMAMRTDHIPGNYDTASAQWNAAHPNNLLPPDHPSGGIPGIISPVGALLTHGGLF